MGVPSSNKYVFNGFEFDADRLVLYRNGEIVKIEKKALEVLAALISNANHVVSTNEIIEAVWKDNPFGITPTHLAQSISKLRKAFADQSEVSIETVKGRGYVLHLTVASHTETRDESEAAAADPVMSPVAEGRRSRRSLAFLLLFLLAAAAVAASYYAVTRVAGDRDDAEIRQLINDSQRFESLVAYRNPSKVDEDKLMEYWLEPGQVGTDADLTKIRAGIARLVRDGRYYGPETRCEQLEIQSIEINSAKDLATVKTLERWFIDERLIDGRVFNSKTVGPYFVHYIVRKVDGRWKIERSTTARATPPQPNIESIEATTPATPGTEFFIKINGSSILSQSVWVKVIGPGCPEKNPCRVPNDVLRTHSDVTESSITNVPLTLASGDFLISIQNGDSVGSNAVDLKVP